jgi:DNA-binding response OmpR family regulator
MLEPHGYEVIEATEGRQGMALHDADPADLVITDILMPGTEGIETIVELRRKHPNTKIIAISGGGRTANMDFLARARQLGADWTLAKPFTYNQILNAVRGVLRSTP